LQKINKK